MAHEHVPAAEEILDHPFAVLDHGFVRLVDYLGGDARIVQSARVSYGEGTRTVREDAALIDYLLRHEHTSPFEQVVLTFHVRMPIFVARQWIRHRTARLNEISGRYSIMPADTYLPAADQIGHQARDNKQGRESEPVAPEEADRIRAVLAEGQAHARADYDGLIDSGLARELARINLPLSTYTELYWQIDLHNLFHFLRLRLDAHAQYEIRAYGEVLLEIAERVAPLATDAFRRHQVGGARFSALEMEALRRALGEAADGESGTGGPPSAADTPGAPLAERLVAAAAAAGLKKSVTREFLAKFAIDLQQNGD